MGTTFCPYSSNDFNFFINDSSLVDVQMGGFAFTRSNVHGTKTTKLEEIIELIPNGVGVKMVES